MRKRVLSSPPLPYEKGMRLEDDEPYKDEPHEDVPRWIRPAQFLARIHDHIVEQYHRRRHFLHRAFVVFKGQNALMHVYSTDRNDRVHNADQFVLVILIENDDVNLLRWEHTYNWNGGWFTTHLKLLCLLDP